MNSQNPRLTLGACFQAQLQGAGTGISKAFLHGAGHYIHKGAESQISENAGPRMRMNLTQEQTQRMGREVLALADSDTCHIDRLRALVEAGADVTMGDAENKTALNFAAGRGHLEAVRLLLAAGAPVDAADATSYTPLLSAIYEGHVAVVETLVRAGADLGKTFRNGMTPLFLAMGYADKAVAAEMARLLIEGGADLGTQGMMMARQTAAEYARARGLTDVVRMIADEPERRRRAALQGAEKETRALPAGLGAPASASSGQSLQRRWQGERGRFGLPGGKR